MRIAWAVSAVFVALLLAARTVGVDGEMGVPIAARVLIFCCFLVGILAGLRQHYVVPADGLPVDRRQVEYKSFAIRSGLIALLLFPTVMGYLFSAWPTVVFNIEFLLILPVLLLLTPSYVCWIEVRMPRPDDDYSRFGEALMRQRQWCWREHKALLLAWAVKLFFIPLMYSWLVSAVEEMLRFSWAPNPALIVAGLFTFGLCIDLLLASAGYFFASRLLGNDIKSTDTHWLGWLSCLICYPPLLAILHTIKQQVDEKVWTHWLSPSEPLYGLWALLICASWLVYWLSTVSFGLKFSNLSWRGLVDVGPYRYTKHPAYLAKNIYWWLHTVPFFGVDNGVDLLRNLLGLTFVSLVYYMRAKTEERHLMAFPEYAAYAARIEREGLFARLRARFIPVGATRGD